MAEAKEAERAAAVLFNRLAELEKVRAGAVWLEERPQLGRDFFRKGRRDPLPDPAPVGGYVALMEACLAVLRPRHNPETDTFVIKPRRSITTPTEAFSRMRAMLGDLPEGAELLTFLPKLTADLQDIKFELRSAISSSLVASLELARIGQAGLEQEIPFGLLIIRPLNSAP